MKQLGILDSAFINLEQTNTPQHIGGLGIYDPSTAPGGIVRFKSVLSNVEQRLAKMPVFRTRLVEVPMGLDKPYWVTDAEFDVEFHLRHIALPEPGDWRQLCIQVARLHSRPLDMTRPLWLCYVIEGLDNIPGLPKGAFAVYTQMHHSLVDGAGSQSFMTALHDLEADPAPQNEEQSEEIDEPFAPEALSNMKMLSNAVVNNAKASVSRTRSAIKLAGDLFGTLQKIKKEELPEYPTNTPRCRFDEPVGPHRVFDAVTFDLEDFKTIRRSTNCTINDVAVCVVSGALRAYLDHHGELQEDESLVGTMPVNVRDIRGETDDNNQIASIMSAIHTNIEDPLQRLAAINHSMGEAKAFIDTPLSEPMKIAGIFSPLVSKTVTKWYVKNEMTRKLPIGTCGVITNVIGPPMQLFSAGARLVEYHCLGLLTPGGALFHSVFSMNGRVSIAALSDRSIMPDPEFYKECIEKSFAALKKAVEDKDAAKPRPTKKKTTKKAASKTPSSSAKAARKKAPKTKPSGNKG